MTATAGLAPDTARVIDRPPTGPGPTLGPSIDDLLDAYRAGTSTPTGTVLKVLAAIADRGADGTWITVVDRAALLRRAAELERHPHPTSLPLYGIPFGVKDSLDVAGLPTTLACPEFAYVPDTTAPAVRWLLDAGAICIGKTNLDQFATGLNGTRTPHPIPRSVYGQGLISGGSSSGSALAVALGQVPFAVATDTAGSGRVPPALNGVVGYKPSRGLLSTIGLVPACRSLDCVTLIAGRVQDLAVPFDVMSAVDLDDPDTRERRRDSTRTDDLRVGLPDLAELRFFGDDAMRDAHASARSRLQQLFSMVDAPLEPFTAAGELLYAGPWVAERLTEFRAFVDEHGDALVPVVRDILRGGRRYDALDVFAAQHRLGQLKAQVAHLWQRMDVLVLPTIGTTFTVEEVLADPVATNTVLGHYTHFGNLLDLCGIAVPAGLTADGRPVSLMILGPALADDRILALAAAWTAATGAPTAHPAARHP